MCVSGLKTCTSIIEAGVEGEYITVHDIMLRYLSFSLDLFVRCTVVYSLEKCAQ